MNEKQMDGLCKAGCIVSIISSGIIMLLTIIGAIITLTALSSVETASSTSGGISEVVATTKKITAIFWIVVALLQLLPLFFSINLLRGKANSNIPAGVISLIFSGVIGGILILVGKYTATPVDTSVTQQPTVEV
ncbi:hypothetical protein [Spiroplasma sp. AdecLV25b]|uniref:hypothetical protein n=1 Tax=Spiroplasma sp. AdecLV25b TaxID=3027162 RepID=UPI0027DFDFDE|nr:hypothetical protein [Spiroplasma sp. AdecLV25b]